MQKTGQHASSGKSGCSWAVGPLFGSSHGHEGENECKAGERSERGRRSKKARKMTVKIEEAEEEARRERKRQRKKDTKKKRRWLAAESNGSRCLASVTWHATLYSAHYHTTPPRATPLPPAQHRHRSRTTHHHQGTVQHQSAINEYNRQFRHLAGSPPLYFAFAHAPPSKVGLPLASVSVLARRGGSQRCSPCDAL